MGPIFFSVGIELSLKDVQLRHTVIRNDSGLCTRKGGIEIIDISEADFQYSEWKMLLTWIRLAQRRDLKRYIIEKTRSYRGNKAGQRVEDGTKVLSYMMKSDIWVKVIGDTGRGIFMKVFLIWKQFLTDCRLSFFWIGAFLSE